MLFMEIIKLVEFRELLYTFREDPNDTVTINIDDYGFSIKSSESKGEITGPLKTEHHHIDDMPSFLKQYMPERMKAKVERVKERLFKRQN